MGTIQVFQFCVLDIDGRAVKAGSLSEPVSVAIGDDKMSDDTFVVDEETPTKIWDAAETLGNFDFCFLQSDFDLKLQFSVDVDGTNIYATKELKGSGVAGQMGVALILGSDASQLLDGTIDTFDGTSAVIEEIWAYHDGTDNESVRVRRLVAT